MPRINVKQGELAHWLQLIAAEREAGLIADAVPSNVREGLILLSCVTESEQGKLVVTEKGRLSLRMSAPDAIHLA
ncbi:hypothetical protein [Bordetella sp. 15P40C-2]|uniref:hypothetical protein n=1 Tax=Bordetella sp. 15P40C-2 TaxID=2572246 RepID=UPI001323E548|nr:hypothetical protein [Bordetella sp. 15P40C-2]MVW70968.1 hypothetical protein [Bordetella sp. 15P40C-2]